MLPGWPGNSGIGRPAPNRRHPVRQPLAGCEGVLLGQPSYSATVRLDLSGTARRSSPAAAAGGRCQGCPATVAQSGWPWQASSGPPAWRRLTEGAARDVQIWQTGLAGPPRRRPVRQPSSGGEGELPGQPSYGGTVWPAPVGAIWHGSLALEVRGRFWGGLATAAPCGRPRQAPSGVVPWRHRQVGAIGAARLQQHHPATPSRLHPARRPVFSSEGALPRRTVYGGTVWPALAFATWCGSPAPATRLRCQGHLGSIGTSQRSPEGSIQHSDPAPAVRGEAGAAQLQQHGLASSCAGHHGSPSLATWGRCHVYLTMAARPGWPRQAPSSTAAPGFQ